ncbi:5'-nucleotidase C-terminal domain-containing protein [Zhengella sp. ZM62]|uniref:5'-nucleotidase C-terminal domain-containing protein n=1 Tax=Zhengella sedimenti TaxID=3390035 RepID=UPI003974A7BC
MNRIAATAALSASLLALTAAQGFAESLNILHINDWHSRIESINKYDSTCSAEDETEGKCFGGAARLVTAVREARAAMGEDQTVFLNAGDNFQGSLFYSTYKGEAEAEFLAMMGTDVMTIGNHEFDDGEPGLATFMEKVSFPVISANVLPSYKSALAGKIEPSVVIEKGGMKYGIVGAVANDTDELSSPGEDILIAQDVAAITDAVKALQEQGIDRIIALTHVGYPRDLAAIAKIPGVDVVVGGHSHTYLANGDDSAEGPYPTWVDNPEGYRVPVVQAKSYSKYLGKLTVTFDDNGVVTAAEGAPMLLDASVKPDEAAAARVKELAAPIEELKAKVVASTEGPIEGSREVCRAGECAMGNLVADAMLDRVSDQGIEIAIQNGGGLRASIDAGDVTMGEVLTVLPFQNTLATFQLKGADIVAALENGVSQVEEGAGRFPQVAGLRFTWDPAGEPGSRIRSVEVGGNGDWQAIDPDKTYGVATNNFMRAGGDGYKVFATNGMNAYDYGPGLEEVVATYLSAKAPYQPINDGGRIMKVEAAAPAAEEKPAEAAAAEKPAETMAEKPAETGLKVPERPGFTMQMPASGPKVEAPAAEAGVEMKAGTMDGGMKKHVIVARDNFWDLARTYYGDPRMWQKIAEANPDMKATGLVIGQELVIPAAQ